jgi:Phage terminase large subunit (GpA)
MKAPKEKGKRGAKPLPEAERLRGAKESAAKHLAQKNAATLASQDIGEIPACKNPERREHGLSSLQRFCETYLKKIFDMPWSKNHLSSMSKSDRIVEVGGKQAIGQPRGDGKSTRCRAIVLRATLGGWHPFAIYIGATADKADEGMDFIKSQLRSNELLLEDFPEVCFPIWKIDNEPRKCRGQHIRGFKTNIIWSPKKICFPTVKGSPLSGFTISKGSMDSAVRGGTISLPDGRSVRPSLAIVDDPQTEETAISQGPGSQTEKRLSKITRSIQGLAGPNSRISIFIPCTAIEQGDLADQILNKKKFPGFHGERTKRLYSWPMNMKLWDQYREIRDDCDRADMPPIEATEFYRARMCTQGRRLDDPAQCSDCPLKSECMDCGGVIDWVERLDNKPEMLDEERNISSLQAAMHSFFDYGPAGFASEFQNEPLLNEIKARMPTADEICEKANGYSRGVVPSSAIHTIAFIDPGEYYHTWGACGFAKNFTGSTIDYGTLPDQGRQFSKANHKRTLDDEYPGAGKKGALLAGLVALMRSLLEKQFQQDGYGNLQKIELCLIDTGHFPEEVHSAIRMVASPIFRASHGYGINATRTQFVNYKKEKCREMGNHWWVPKDATNNTIWIDTNYWKTQTHVGIRTMAGDPGALTFFGKPDDVRLTAAHILAEYYKVPKSEEGIDVQVWFNYPGKDNELLDILVGCQVAASKLGCSSIPTAPQKKRPVRRLEAVASSSTNPEWS